jgi:hypothetical protein
VRMAGPAEEAVWDLRTQSLRAAAALISVSLGIKCQER